MSKNHNHKAITFLNILFGTTLTFLMINILAKQYFISQKTYLKIKHTTNFIDNSVTILSKLNYDFNNAGIIKLLNNKYLFIKHKPPIDTCFPSLNSCVGIIPKPILKKARQDKIETQSQALTLYNVTEFVSTSQRAITNILDPICLTKKPNIRIKIGNEMVIIDGANNKTFETFIVSNIFNNCLAHDIFYNKSAKLKNLYNDKSKVYKLSNVSYFIGLDNRNISSLYRHVWGDKSEVIAANIKMFTVHSLQHKVSGLFKVKLRFNDINKLTRIPLYFKLIVDNHV